MPSRSFICSVVLIFASVTVLPPASFAQYPGAAPVPADLKRGFDTIQIANEKKNLTFLSGPECLGRGTGQPGFFKAAEFMASKFKEAGLKPVGDHGTYFQLVPFWRSEFMPKASSIQAPRHRKLGALSNFQFANVTENTLIDSPIIDLTPKGDDLGADNSIVQGKIAIIHAPKLTTGLRVALLYSHPAAALFVVDRLPLNPDVVRRKQPSPDPEKVPTGTITAKAAADIEAAAGLTPSGSQVSASPIHLKVMVDAGPIGVPNVVGLLEGSDPALKNEIVGLGAHLDHLGVQNGNVYPGADDDGSGDTSIIEITRAFRAAGTHPKRSLLFMAFCGEEMGLIGSGYYSDHPVFPHQQMVAELQMDMVGRDSYGAQNGDKRRMDVVTDNFDTMRLVGSKRISTDLDDTINECNKYVNFRFRYDAEDVYTRSDHYNFAKHGVPIAFLFDGFTPDYHQPTDTVDKIDFTKIANTARLYYMTATRLANADQRPRHNVAQTR